MSTNRRLFVLIESAAFVLIQSAGNISPVLANFTPGFGAVEPLALRPGAS